MEHQFTAKMQKALAHYAADESRNKPDAYRHAYSCSGMQEKTIRVKAWELFEHPLMATAVMSMNAAAAAETGINAAWVMKRLALLASFNISRFIRVDEASGIALYDFTEATDDDWYCITEYTAKGLVRGADATYAVDELKIKSACKLKALELVGKHTNVQAFKERVEHTGVVGVAAMTVDEYKDARREMLGDDDC